MFIKSKLLGAGLLAALFATTAPAAAFADSASLANDPNFIAEVNAAYGTHFVNGAVSAVMMKDGAVMMKVEMPAKEFDVINRDMKANHKTCTIEEIYPGETDTMILVCGDGA